MKLWNRRVERFGRKENDNSLMETAEFKDCKTQIYFSSRDIIVV
jgi:hypothetical protein